MAKQPYIPLYIGDWEQDTNCLSLEAEGAWLKIIFKMFKDDKSGVYKTSTKGLQNLWKCDTKRLQKILKELSDNNVCGLETGDYIIFSNRRMIRDYGLSKVRSDAVNNRYKSPTKPVHPLEYDNDINSSDIKEFESIEGILLSSPGTRKDFLPVFEKMMQVFQSKFSGYFKDPVQDYPACERIASKTEKLKSWDTGSVTNGRMVEFIAFWGELVEYIAGDEWLSGRSLNDLSTREWQRLGQHMNKKNLPVVEKPKKEDGMSDYQKEIEEKRAKARGKKSS